MRIVLFTAALVALPVLTACGSDKAAATPPKVTAADLSKALRDKGVRDQGFTDCAAKIYVDEGISQDGLRAMIGSEYDKKAADPNTLGMSKEDADKARSANDKIFKQCSQAG
ncbi:hypothetical protein [Nocardia arthritidis]|uniref:DUF732 domain-containing protein n=1 Tax=Nocardia arthritidis TaxID=228602 RepID=A0A6G9YTW8_9NOCA|nr:hypothetical protein [Nocardia arthritidis]QIS16541.1 hypothetical protein F5544_43690 [Nocardia arthritidis]